MFSARSAFSDEPNPLTRAVARRRASGGEILDLTCGNPSQLGLGFDPEALREALADPRVDSYEPEPFGRLETRRAICRQLGARGFAVAPEDVLLTASTSEAYGYLFKLLCDPGDSVLVPSPSYPLLDALAQLEGVTLVPYRLSFDGEWHLQTELAGLVAEMQPRAIIVVHPHNPSGSFLKRDELDAIARVGLPIISDEVFGEYGFDDDARRAVSALEASGLVFRMAGASKSLGLPQLKLAWTVLHGPEAEVCEARERLSHIADAYLSPSTAAQLAVETLLPRASIQQRVISERCRENLARLRRSVEGSSVSCLHVEGGWYAILRLPALFDDEAWALRLLEREGVLVQPGFFFELYEGVHVVLSLLTEPSLLLDGVLRILACVAQAE